MGQKGEGVMLKRLLRGVSGLAYRLRSLSLKTTLIIYFLIFILLPTGVISITSYSMAATDNIRNIRNSSRINLEAIETYLQQIFYQLDGIADTIISSSQLRAVLNSQQTDNRVIANQVIMLNSLLQEAGSVNVLNDIPFTTRIYLIDQPEYYSFSSLSNVLSIRSIVRENWFAQLPTYFDYRVLAQEDSFLFVRRFYNLYSGRLTLEGVLTMEIPMEAVLELLNQSKLTESTVLFLVDNASGEVLCSTGDQTAYPSAALTRQGAFYAFEEVSWQGSPHLFSSLEMADTGWRVVSATRTGELNANMDAYRTTLLLLLISCMMLGCGLAVLLSDSFTSPIRRLVASMEEVGKGNLSESISYKRNDEFRYLIQKYNGMVNQLDNLIYQLQRTEQMKKEAELASLQAQINPHFLYNTLDSITMLAMWDKSDDVIEMTSALSDFFRYSLSKGKTIIPLSDELLQLKSYLRIQSLRYEDMLDYAIDVDGSLMAVPVPKLILQPLVENSIKHGIQPSGRKGAIVVKGRRENDDIVLTVTDDGLGADTDELNQMVTAGDYEQGRAYGIKNVHWRIQNVYGDGYGLVFRANPAGGVIAVIRLKPQPPRKSGGSDYA